MAQSSWHHSSAPGILWASFPTQHVPGSSFLTRPLITWHPCHGIDWHAENLRTLAGGTQPKSQNTILGCYLPANVLKHVSNMCNQGDAPTGALMGHCTNLHRHGLTNHPKPSGEQPGSLENAIRGGPHEDPSCPDSCPSTVIACKAGSQKVDFESSLTPGKILGPMLGEKMQPQSQCGLQC